VKKTVICTLSDAVKQKLEVIFDTCEKTGSPETLSECEKLGVSVNDWLKFCCDKLGIINLC
jgi:hypothetical protein